MSKVERRLDGRTGHLIAVGQFVVLPALAMLGAAAVTDFPNLDRYYSVEVRALQFSAILAGLGSGMFLARVFRSSAALQSNKPVRHFAVVAVALLGGHLLWVQPVWGFHHDYSLGIFAWLFLGGEDGFFVFPNPCGLPLTLFLQFCLLFALRSFVNLDPAASETLKQDLPKK